MDRIVTIRYPLDRGSLEANLKLHERWLKQHVGAKATRRVPMFQQLDGVNGMWDSTNSNSHAFRSEYYCMDYEFFRASDAVMFKLTWG